MTLTEKRCKQQVSVVSHSQSHVFQRVLLGISVLTDIKLGSVEKKRVLNQG